MIALFDKKLIELLNLKDQFLFSVDGFVGAAVLVISLALLIVTLENTIYKLLTLGIISISVVFL